MGEKRKLSAVLFADIAGYTAMMQDDEKLALTLINKFKKTIESVTPDFHGQIIQFYGDGCLLTFESSTEAVDCAIAFQHAFSQEPQIPVRIGLHMGEVLYKNNGAFGNGINIASRIESMGIPGSILVSKTIRDQIINKAGFLLASLGSFEFKNVKEPMEVFALANEGFVIPDKIELEGKFKLPVKKKVPKLLLIGLPVLLLIIAGVFWYVNKKNAATTLSDEQREQPVAVMAFENLTKDKALDDVSGVAKDWISYGLLESGKAPVIILNEERSAQFNSAKEKFGDIPTGVGIVINGRFFDQSDGQIATVAEILDVKTKKVLFTLNPVVAVKDSIMLMLDQVKRKVVEYWDEDEASSGKKPPLYQAYKLYLKGARNEKSDLMQAREFYYEALKLDSSFNAPLFAMAKLANNNAEPELRDSVMQLLARKENDFTSFEKKTWENLKTLVSGENEKK